VGIEGFDGTFLHADEKETNFSMLRKRVVAWDFQMIYRMA